METSIQVHLPIIIGAVSLAGLVCVSAQAVSAAVLECISLVSSITELILLHYRTRLTFPFLPMPGRIGQI